MLRFVLSVLIFLTLSSQTLAQDSGPGLLEEFIALSKRIQTLEDQNAALTQRLDGLEPNVSGPTQPISQIKQALAQAACLGIHSSNGQSGWVRAVHRPIASPSGWDINNPDAWLPVEDDKIRVTCDTVCNQLINHPASGQEQRNSKRFSCFSSLHIYEDAPMEAENAVTGLKTYYYGGGCTNQTTGPNYCCCKTIP
ncbi:hypothetical protein [Ruegeria sp. HKCCD7318]|uniref:hypothetical protein n=1 Tax=Ruegeria sp. HKCCD7318 TaxID=2683014 RepID=UPI0014930104|nr:hypothetical protein [Ruegeria sp. HKCCD7318]NOE36224.1 hypothetical protein [Ruegeria sp. HKCCD7318]